MVSVMKLPIFIESAIWASRALWLDTVVLASWIPPLTASMLSSTFGDSSSLLNLECARLERTSHVDTASDGNVADDDRVSDLVNEEVGVSVANAGEDLNRRRFDPLGNVMNSVSTTLAVLFCQLLSLV